MAKNIIPHARHVRHAGLDRVRHASVFGGFISNQAQRLSVTNSVVLNTLFKRRSLSAEQIAKLSLDDLDYPVNVSPPSISGDAVVGQVLTANNGTWTDADTFTFMWFKDHTLISEATGNTYTVGADDTGAKIMVVVSGANEYGSVAKESAEVGPVTAA